MAPAFCRGWVLVCIDVGRGGPRSPLACSMIGRYGTRVGLGYTLTIFGVKQARTVSGYQGDNSRVSVIPPWV